MLLSYTLIKLISKSPVHVIENLKQCSYLKCSYLKMGSRGNALAVSFYRRQARLRSRAHYFHCSTEKRCGQLGRYVSSNEIHVLCFIPFAYYFPILLTMFFRFIIFYWLRTSFATWLPLWHVCGDQFWRKWIDCSRRILRITWSARNIAFVMPTPNWMSLECFAPKTSNC